MTSIVMWVPDYNDFMTTRTTAAVLESGATRNASDRRVWRESYRTVRAFTEALCAPLQTEDYVIQSMPDASPAKWHLAHTSWFFQTFVLQQGLAGFRGADPHYAFLFNSYYNAVGPMHCRAQRGMISRPTVEEVYTYRRQTDDAMLALVAGATEDEWRAVEAVVELGLHHEQQHQELLLTDLKHMFAQNPLRPAYNPSLPVDAGRPAAVPGWISYDEGLHWIGHEGDGFCFDNERPRHRVFVGRFQLAQRPVTNGEYSAFIEDGGYERPEHWLSLGWMTVREQRWSAPLYWERTGDGRWSEFTLGGVRPLDPAQPVAHVSYFEADAFARWSGARLPDEAEWEVAASHVPVDGNFAERERFHPAALPLSSSPSSRPAQMYGDVWEWTRSSYAPYPGYAAPAGAIGEYNGKFMCNQYVLRGGSCATSRSHIRPTYRNFFPPDRRWQFSGLRLARDVA
jgi:ergothioneine biosynthesis protein EgtB